MENNLKELPEGQYGLVMANGDESASQLVLTEEQSILFKSLLYMISKEKPLVKLPPEYDLVLKSNKYIVATSG